MFNSPPPNRSDDTSIYYEAANNAYEAFDAWVSDKKSRDERDDELETSTIAGNQESSSGSDDSGK